MSEQEDAVPVDNGETGRPDEAAANPVVWSFSCGGQEGFEEGFSCWVLWIDSVSLLSSTMVFNLVPRGCRRGGNLDIGIVIRLIEPLSQGKKNK